MVTIMWSKGRLTVPWKDPAVVMAPIVIVVAPELAAFAVAVAIAEALLPSAIRP